MINIPDVTFVTESALNILTSPVRRAVYTRGIKCGFV